MGAVHPTGTRAVLFDFGICRRKLPGAGNCSKSCGLPQLAPQDAAAPSKTPVIPSGPGQCAVRAAAAKAELGIALLRWECRWGRKSPMCPRLCGAVSSSAPPAAPAELLSPCKALLPRRYLAVEKRFVVFRCSLCSQLCVGGRSSLTHTHRAAIKASTAI